MNPQQVELLKQHLDWSKKQGRILTAQGRAEDYFSEFSPDDLPHVYLPQGGVIVSRFPNPWLDWWKVQYQPKRKPEFTIDGEIESGDVNPKDKSNSSNEDVLQAIEDAINEDNDDIADIVKEGVSKDDDETGKEGQEDELATTGESPRKAEPIDPEPSENAEGEEEDDEEAPSPTNSQPPPPPSSPPPPPPPINPPPSLCPIVVGVWKRPLFCGEWEYSTQATETVFNIQTSSLFVDLRIPTTREDVFKSVQHLTTGDVLRNASRQHVFAGFTRITETKDDSQQHRYPHFATRFHAMDWNYIGKPRTRPNQWYIELPQSSSREKPPSKWKEWSYATDRAGQSYYCEHWHRVPDAASKQKRRILSLYRCHTSGTPTSSGPTDSWHKEGIIVLVGSHFNYCCQQATHAKLARLYEQVAQLYPEATTAAEAMDAAVKDSRMELAQQLLSRLAGGHGRVTNKGVWKVDLATEPWQQGKAFWPNRVSLVVLDPLDPTQVQNEPPQDMLEIMPLVRIRHQGDEWCIHETNIATLNELKALF